MAGEEVGETDRLPITAGTLLQCLLFYLFYFYILK